MRKVSRSSGRASLVAPGSCTSVPATRVRSGRLVSMYTWHFIGICCYILAKAVDPHSFCLLDPDPGGKIFQIKTEKMQWKRSNQQVYSIFKKLICTCFIVSYFWAIFNVFLKPNKTLHKVIFDKFVSAGSRSAFLKQLNPDPHSDKLLDTDPKKMNSDPQPWF